MWEDLQEALQPLLDTQQSTAHTCMHTCAHTQIWHTQGKREELGSSYPVSREGANSPGPEG